MKIIDSYDQVFKDVKKVLVVLAHPDDAEIYCGGTISRLTSDGKVVRVVKVTDGSMGSRLQVITQAELKKIRRGEDADSMKILGVKSEDNVFLDLCDGRVTNRLKTIGKIAFQIRQFKPDLIITHNPEDVVIKFDKDSSWINHRDHRNTGKSTIDAAYPYSRDLLFFPNHFKTPGVSSHQVTKFLLVDYYHHSDTLHIDMTEFANNKTMSIATHKSQYSPTYAQETTDFFTQKPDGKRYECFRYVIVD